MRKKTGTIQPRGDAFRIAYYDADHLRQYETIHGAFEDAQRELLSRLSDVAKGIPVSSKPNTVLFGELCADVVKHYQVNELASESDIEARYRLHITPALGKKKAATITTAQLNSYILKRKAEGAKPGTVNRELEAIRRAYKLALAGRKIHHMPHIPRVKENNVRQGFFTRDEVDRLCRHLPAPYDAFTLFAFLTGWRKDEIRNLKWANVDFIAGVIRLEPGSTKNGEGRSFPMSDELRVLLAETKRRATASANDAPRTASGMVAQRMPATAKQFPVDYVFAVAGRPILEFRKNWKTACHKAGLPCIYSTEGKLLKAVRIFHDLRRSAVRELVRVQGLSEREAMMLTGHLTRSVFDRYSIVNERDLEGIRAKLNGAKNGAKAATGNAGN